MAQNYTRQSSFADGDTITASLFNNEYNQLVNAFTYSSTDVDATGHRHDGTSGEGGNIYRIGDLNFLNKIEADSVNNRWGFFVEVSSTAVEQIRIQDGVILPVITNDIDLGSATFQFKDLYLDGTANIDSLVLSSGSTVTAILDEDNLVSDSATALATQQSIKAYVDAQVTAQDLDFQGDTGGALSIDLDSETLTIAGGTGIDTAGATNTLTVSIDSTVATLTGTQTLTNKTIDADNNTVSNLEVDNLKSGVLDTDISSVAGTHTTLPSALAVKTYVDAQVTAQDLDIFGDTGTDAIDLDSETLTFTGGTGITSVVTAGTVTHNIDSTVATLTGTQTLTNKTLTSPDINGGTVDGAVIGGTSPSAITGTTITGTSFVSSGDMTFGDDDKAIFGAGSDLQIYHDGSNSYVQDAGTGSLNIKSNGAFIDIQSDSTRINNAANNEIMATFVANGAVTAYYDNSAKLATTATGIDVTGTVTADGLTVDGTTATIQDDSANLRFENSAGTRTGYIQNRADAFEIWDDQATPMIFGTNNAERLRIDSAGTLFQGTTSPTLHSSMTGTVFTNGSLLTEAARGADKSLTLAQNVAIDAGNTWAYLSTDEASYYQQYGGNHYFATAASGTAGADATLATKMIILNNGNVGIGESNPASPLDIHVATDINMEVDSNASVLRISAVNDARSTNPAMSFQALSYDFRGAGGIGTRAVIDSSGNVGIGGTQASSKLFVDNGAGTRLYIGLSNNIYADAYEHIWRSPSAASERMRIDASGNLLVGKTAANFTVAGHELKPGGFAGFTRDGGSPIIANRLTNDGAFIEFNKNGTTVGSIGISQSGSVPYIGGTDTGICFNSATNGVLPADTSTPTAVQIDAAKDLGFSSVRWRDLYLSGTVNAAQVNLADAGGTLRNVLDLDGSSNLQIGTGSSVGTRAITFFTENAEQMRLDASGRVGIGTSSPTGAKLQVVAESGSNVLGVGTTTQGLFIKTTGTTVDYNSSGNSAGEHTFSTGNTERMRITSSGALELTGDSGAGTTFLNFTADSNATKAQISGSKSGASGGNLIFSTNNTSAALTERMRIDSSGNVGIAGQTNPTYKLDGGFADQTWGWYLNSSYNAGFTYNTAERSLLLATRSAENIDHIKFATGSAATERVRIDGEGSLLVGTTSTSAGRHFTIGNATAPAQSFQQNGTEKFLCGISGGINGGVTGSASGDYFARTAGGKMLFSTNDGVTAHAVIDSSGNLLVGQTSADSNSVGIGLLSNGTAYAVRDGGAAFIAHRKSSDGNIVEFLKDNVPVGSIGTYGGASYYGGPSGGLMFNGVDINPTNGTATRVDATNTIGAAAYRFKDLYLSGKVASATDNFYQLNDGVFGTIIQAAGGIKFNTSGANERARIDTSGNLLVGRTTTIDFPTNTTSGIRLGADRFDMAADSLCRLTQLNNASGTFDRFYIGSSIIGTITGSGSTTSYNTSSDQRLKENIADADDAGSKIDAIKVRQYDWKADGSHQDYGMVAQELMTVAPEAVSGDPESDEMMGVDYSKLVPMMLKEIQSLRARVAQLEGAN
jgi:hypothetical protein